jgi:putative transposase
VLEAMRDLSAQYPRFGYRRIHVFVGRRGFDLGADRVHRISRSAGLQVPRKRPSRRVAGGIRSRRVIEVLSQLISVHGAPKHLRSNNGPEFVSKAILKWLSTANIDTALE